MDRWNILCFNDYKHCGTVGDVQVGVYVCVYADVFPHNSQCSWDRLQDHCCLHCFAFFRYICVCRCRYGIRPARNASAKAWWSTTTGTSMPLSSSMMSPKWPPLRIWRHGSRSVMATVCQRQCPVSWSVTSVTWWTKSRSHPTWRLSSLTHTTCCCLRRLPKTPRRAKMWTPFLCAWHVAWRPKNLLSIGMWRGKMEGSGSTKSLIPRLAVHAKDLWSLE